MGVFTVGRQVALEIDMPGWWLANASVDMDFRRGLYYDSSTANPRAATDFLSCVRASTGYATTAAGTLTSFASNSLRVTSNGLLIEDSRTNAQAFSQDITGSGGGFSWFLDNVSNGTATVAPDGTNTAQQVIENSSLGYHRIYNNGNAPSLTASVATGSIYLKDGSSNGRRYIGVQLIDSISGARQSVVCDLQAGTITQTGTRLTPGGTPVWHINALASGWYRVDISYTLSGTGGELNVFGCNSATPTLDAFALIQYTGDGVSNFYVWGNQIENGAFPSSYIPTTGAAATRATDAVLCIGNANTILSALPHTSVINIMALVAPSTTLTVLGDDTDGQTDLYSNSENNRVGSILAGANLGSSLFPTSLFTTGAKVGTAVATSARSIAGDGGTVSTDTNAAAGTSGFIYLGSGAPSFRVWFGYIRRATFWNSKLADATLQALTAP